MLSLVRMIQLWGLKGAQQNDTILKAIKRRKYVTYTVWFMRQAGRSQPEYRKLKEKYSLFEITHQPELCICDTFTSR